MPIRRETLSAAEARRIALGAQGFTAPRPAGPGPRDLLRAAERLNLFQIDSVNVLVRAHYLPAFSRLGKYDRTALDRIAWGPMRQRRLFEYWAHEASLLPLDLHPLLRWRMTDADAGVGGYQGLRVFAGERRGEAMALLDRLRGEGPLTAKALAGASGKSGWWEWSDGKRALEWLFWAGHVTTATRLPTFERVYDLPDRVLPATIVAQATPDRAAATRALIDRAARAFGVATATELRDYFRLPPGDAARATAELIEGRALIPVTVRGWNRPALLHADARLPRRVSACALLAPFDPLVWERGRTERLFEMRYRIGIYTPAGAREHGYYVLPFLLGDALVARVDLKADRAGGGLMVQQLTLEPGAPADTREALNEALDRMADWLGLSGRALAGNAWRPPTRPPIVA